MTRTEFLDKIRALYRPQLVIIDPDAIARLPIVAGQAELVGCSFPFAPAANPARQVDGTLSADAVKTLRYLLALTSLQYRFWKIQPLGSCSGEFVRYEYEGRVGSTGMMYAFDRAWGDELDPAPGILAAAQSEDGVRAAFGEHFPSIPSRLHILAEAMSPKGVQVCEEVLRYVVTERKVTVDLANTVAAALPAAYGDPFLKKAMLFLGFVASYLRQDIDVADELCAYADYQVPSVLRHYGVLKYTESLAVTVDSRGALPRNGADETAIRAATILACEQIAETFGVTAAEVDWWCFVQRKLPTKPFHLTVTTHY